MRLLVATTFLLFLAGCPRENEIPPAPSDARTCESLADCNEGRTCGQLSACAGGFCETTRSLDLPCPASP